MEFSVLTHLLKIIKKTSTTQVIHQTKLAISLCNLCGSPPKTYPLLCDYCLNDLPLFNYALIENNLLNWPAINKALPNYTFDTLYAVSPHLWPFTQWITLLKYKGRFDLASLLGHLLYDRWIQDVNQPVSGSEIDSSLLVISVPLHPKKWQLRGYNQAHLIAKHFAKHGNINYRHNAIARINETDSQVGKTGSSRRTNMKDAFQLNQNIHWPKHVIVIDDVITTGSTVSEVAKLLKENGVEKVTVLTITISLPKQ